MTVTVVGTCFLVNAVLSVLLASFVWSRRRGGAGRALSALLVSTALWSAAYTGELYTTGEASLRWGDAKYVGISLLVPSFVAFVLCWTGRSRLLSPIVLVLLAIEPVVVLSLLVVPATHDLVRSLDPAGDPTAPALALSGPLFWFHLVYANLLLVGSVVVFVTSLLRRARYYQTEAWTLVAAALLPFAVNLGFNLRLDPFASVDLTPIAFTVSAAVLARALLERRLLGLAPIAFGTVVRGMREGVLVLDDERRVVEANPAALDLLGWQTGWRGRDLPDELLEAAQGHDGVHETRFVTDSRRLDLEIQVSDLPDSRGHAGGRLLVVRDVTRRRAEELRRDRALAEQARVAATLSRSLRPSGLPTIPGVELGAVYRPAGAGREVGGDFYDVHALGDGWAFAIGDVSGKGASSAAITAMARYTLRALSVPGQPPSTALAGLNRNMVDETEDETYLTVATGVLTPGEDGVVEVVLALGGHAQPLLVPRTGPVRAVGIPGGAIGLFADVEHADETFHLGPDDALVLFTDGVTEARGETGLFGEQRLVDLLEWVRGLDAAGLADCVADHVLAFQRDDAADDIAVLVIRVSDPARVGREDRS